MLWKTNTPIANAVLAFVVFASPSSLDIWYRSSPYNIVDAHGYLESPRSRNFYAHEVGPQCSGAECPPAEYCPHCLNLNDGVCGKFGSRPFESDSWLDKNGVAMPWIAQAVYDEGQVIAVRSYLDTHHNGHMEIRACDKGPDCTPEDFVGNELVFVEDTVLKGNHEAMPKDPNYPERGMYAGGQGGGVKEFEFLYQLPMGVYGDQVTFQWIYITANSCSPPGYAEYFAAHPQLPSNYWTQGVNVCTPPYPNDGTRGTTWPEQFFNCAEVKIIAGDTSPAPPISSPTPKPSVSRTSPPISSPTPYPTLKPAMKPTLKPVDSSTTCCTDRGSGYQECHPSAWCNANESQCSNCSGVWTVAPVVRYGCCTWGGWDCSNVDPSSNKGCQYMQSDCEGSCGGTWQFF